MPKLLDTINDDLYPAWSSGDAGRFEETARRLFAHNVEYVIWGRKGEGLDSLLGMWLEEFAAWNPQRWEMQPHRVDGGDAASWQYRWSGTHTGVLRLPDGTELAPSRRDFERYGYVIARQDHRHLINRWNAFSTYQEILCELSGRSPAEIKAM